MSERSYHRATSSSPIFTSRSPVKKDTTQSMFIILVYLPVFVCGAFTFQSLYVVRLPSSFCMWCVYLPVIVCGAFTFQSLYVVRLPSSLCMWCVYLPVFVCGAFTFQSLYVVRLPSSLCMWCVYLPVFVCGAFDDLHVSQRHDGLLQPQPTALG